MKRSMVRMTIACAALALVLTGCGQKELQGGTSTPQPAVQASTPAPTESPTPKPEPMLEKEVSVYYTDNDLNKLVEKKTKVQFKAADDVYAATLEALKKTDDPDLKPLFANVTFKSVKVEGKTMTIDLVLGEGSQFGSGGEGFFVKALENTAFQFEEISELYILNNGEKVESLMGHVELQYPFKKK